MLLPLIAKPLVVVMVGTVMVMGAWPAAAARAPGRVEHAVGQRRPDEQPQQPVESAEQGTAHGQRLGRAARRQLHAQRGEAQRRRATGGRAPQPRSALAAQVDAAAVQRREAIGADNRRQFLVDRVP
ncbi:hypothetical protein [Burkholderia sp. LMU1-1-1.1]|uniref:hypothetical protein n=1 Tax=Burkholderia sp. LMU1-1-1.1 TaxID=3135266 RepID=UPI003419CCDB